MKKRSLFSVFLAVSIALGTMPLTAFAADDAWRDMDLRGVKSDVSGEGWDWDGSDNILTLKNFNATVPAGERENSAAILLPEDSTVWLEGDKNELTVESAKCSGIYGIGDLTFRGDGKIKITISSFNASTIYAEGGVVSFENKVEITADTPNHVIYVMDAHAKSPVVSVTDKAKVIFPDDLTDDAVYIITKRGVKPESITFDYDEEKDKDEETITLVKAAKKPEAKPEEKPETKPEEKPEIPKNIYEITIGKAAITKNGEVVYRAEALPYLSQTEYTMLPLRALLMVSDPSVAIAWDATTQTATISYLGDTYQVSAHKNTMTKNGLTVPMVTKAELSEKRLFVSLRDWMYIMDIPSSQVEWDSKTETVKLSH